MIDPDRVLVWVHTWHGRDGMRDKTLASLAASDVGDYELMRQPENIERNDYYLRVLRDISSRPGFDYMLRIEDDTLVNEHLMHNVSRWGAVNDPLFGAGWLSVTADLLADTFHVRSHSGCRVREYKECHFAGGVLMAIPLLRQLLPRIEKRLRQGTRFAPGCSVSHAVFKSGKRVFFHEPSIVYINMSIPTYHGTTRTRWRQPYSGTWRA